MRQEREHLRMTWHDKLGQLRGMWLRIFLLCGSILVGTGLLDAQETTVQDKLAQVVEESTLEITTIGRKSGKPRTKPIWFVYDQETLYLQSGKDGKTHWYRNLQKNPQMKVKIGNLNLSGHAQFVADAAETQRVHDLFRSKYTFARVAGLVGSSIGHGKVVIVKELSETPSPE